MSGPELGAWLRDLRRPRQTDRASLEALRRVVHDRPAAGANQRSATRSQSATVHRPPGPTAMPPESPPTRSNP